MVLRKLTLNMSQIYSEIGLKPALSLGIEGRDRGLASARSYTSKKSSQGDQMAAIQSGSDQIVAIATQEATPQEPGLTMDVTPKSLVKAQFSNARRIDIFA